MSRITSQKKVDGRVQSSLSRDTCLNKGDGRAQSSLSREILQ